MGDHSPFWYFAHNKTAMTTLSAWFIAQSIKVAIGVIREKRFNFKWFVGTGGFPSSHVAGVTALTTAIAFQEGAGTSIFTVTLMFAIVVICDAQGVRYSTGKQAEILNKMLDDIYWKKNIQEDRLKEFVGHTPINAPDLIPGTYEIKVTKRNHGTVIKKAFVEEGKSIEVSLKLPNRTNPIGAAVALLGIISVLIALER